MESIVAESMSLWLMNLTQEICNLIPSLYNADQAVVAKQIKKETLVLLIIYSIFNGSNIGSA